jgi:hypothetical protein
MISYQTSIASASKLLSASGFARNATGYWDTAVSYNAFYSEHVLTYNFMIEPETFRRPFVRPQTHTSRRMRRPTPQLDLIDDLLPSGLDGIPLRVVSAPTLPAAAYPLALADLDPHPLEDINRIDGSRHLPVDRLSIRNIEIAFLLRVRPYLPLLQI